MGCAEGRQESRQITPGAAELQPNQPRAEGAGKSGSSPAGGCPGGCTSALPREELTDRFFQRPAESSRAIIWSDALLAVTAPGAAPTVRRIPSGAAPGAGSPGAQEQLEGFGERLEPFALAAPQAGPGASCLPK